MPLAQVRDSYMELNNRFMPLSWVVRTKAAPFSVSVPIQQAFQNAVDLPVAHIRSMDQIVIGSTARDEFNTLVLVIFAMVAIVLSSIGLYGLMAYSVEQRTLEFGIRLALGADPPDVAEHDRAAGHDASVRGDRSGAGRSLRAHAPDGKPAIQREADRSGSVRLCHGAIHRGVVSGELLAGATHVAGGSGGGPAI